MPIVLIEHAQNRRCVRASAAETRLHRNALADEDLQTFFGQLRRLIIGLCRLPDEVFLVLRIAFCHKRRGRVLAVGLIEHLTVAVHLPRRVCPDVDRYIVVQRNRLHDGLDVVIAVLTLVKHVQRQVDLGKRAF